MTTETMIIFWAGGAFSRFSIALSRALAGMDPVTFWRVIWVLLSCALWPLAFVVTLFVVMIDTLSGVGFSNRARRYGLNSGDEMRDAYSRRVSAINEASRALGDVDLNDW